jgi:prenyl protein peptidase
MSPLLYVICNGSSHLELSRLQALSYCSLLAVSYVISLYCFVPSSVQKLLRDDSLQIRWRALASCLVSIGAVLSYRLLFCNEWILNIDANLIAVLAMARQTLWTSFCVLFHTLVLYFGPIVRSFVISFDSVHRKQGKVTLLHFLKDFSRTFIYSFFQPLFSNDDSLYWTFLRNQVVAPVTEELVFRACMVPALLSTGMTDTSVCLTAPLFFGIAHVHHGILRLRQGYSLTFVSVATLVQFCYTSIFGAYVSYVYLRTGSIGAVVFCHSLCNAMGLPNVSFLQSNSPLYASRGLLLAALAIGLVAFILGLVLYELI